jgi:hypothetical protein
MNNSSNETPNTDGLKPVLDTIRQTIVDAASATRLENEPQTPVGDYESLYHKEREENRRLQDVIASGRYSSPVGDEVAKHAKPGMTAGRLRGLWGELRWQQSTDIDRLKALGVDPSTVDRALLKRLFGLSSQGNDGHEAQQLYRTNRYRYLVLRECAKALGIF